MMILLWLLTAILVIDCIFLILLVLVQLPKKEAGAGLAFGGAATDALFGAGSGTALTKITKYAATIFFVVALLMSLFSGQMRKESSVVEKLQQKAQGAATSPSTQPAVPVPGGSPATTPVPLTTQPGIAPNTAPAVTPSATDAAPAGATTPSEAPKPQ